MSLFTNLSGKDTVMKLRCAFEAVDMGDEIVFVPVGIGADQIHGILRLNREGSEILNLLQNDTTEEAIVNKLASKYENDRSQLASYVQNVVAILRNEGLIQG